MALKTVMGPRIPAGELTRSWARYVLPLTAFILSGLLLVMSIAHPYWWFKMRAPQYPKGLTVVAHVTHLSGDVRELDNLNHYIGMRPLEDGGKLERQYAVAALTLMALLLVSATFVHSRWAVLLAIPLILFPLIFLVDLQAWLWYFGNHLDPTAALSSSIKPFTPRALGLGKVAQFKTLAGVDRGFWMACAASGVAIIGLWLHRRAYKPLVEARRRQADEAA